MKRKIKKDKKELNKEYKDMKNQNNNNLNWKWMKRKFRTIKMLEIKK